MPRYRSRRPVPRASDRWFRLNATVRYGLEIQQIVDEHLAQIEEGDGGAFVSILRLVLEP